jgi:formylglycine-generating enzyme required for sulfatase activity
MGGAAVVALLVAGWFAWRWRVEWLESHARVAIATEPPGARLAIVPISPENGQPDVTRKVVIGTQAPAYLTLPVGKYLVEAAWPDGSTVLVHRMVERLIQVYHATDLVERKRSDKEFLRSISGWQSQSDGRLCLPPIEKHEPSTDGYTLISGGVFVTGSPLMTQFPEKEVEVAPFWIGQNEVSIAEFQAVMGRLPALVATGRRGSVVLPENPLAPVVGVSWYEAVEYAERVGGRLPTLDEYLFAATNGGTTAFPWGDDASLIASWETLSADPPDWDQTRDQPPVRGLYSRVVEWTMSSPGKFDFAGDTRFDNLASPEMAASLSAVSDSHLPPPGQVRVVCGGGNMVKLGTPAQLEYSLGPRMLDQENIGSAGLPGLGFRVVRDVEPRYAR